CEDGSAGEQICLGDGQGFGVCLCDDPTAEDTVEDPGDVVETDEPPLCVSDDECDDGIPCTVDACKDDGCDNILPAGYCVIEDSCVSAGTPNPDNPCEACDPNSELYSWKAQHEKPCDDGNACTTNDACDKDVCRGELLSCDDGLFCNGQETCDGDLGCIPGEAPLLDDAVACTVDVCDELTQSVTHAPEDALCFPSDPCSVAACDPVDGCYNVPLPTCCGNGIVEPGEACDDGNDDEDDDCTTTCEETSEPPPGEPGCPDGMISVLSNAGFETGDFAPWTSNGADTWFVNDAFEGSWAAETNGNFHVAQDFPPVPVAHLALASFWTWHEPGAGGIMSVSWSYGDGSTGSTFLNSEELEGWNQVHLLPLMDPTKELSGITTWGYAGGGPEPDISRFDSYQFCLGDGEVCIPNCGGKT
ncbi:MAG: hypothetical protein VX938_13130, partial [Myxococcota bacterium]|nr:hypothetical protein [Myxococcota bacterium]